MWADSHSHLFGTEAVEEARLAGVARMVAVGTDAATSVEAVEAARAHEGVWATIGLHPHDAIRGLGGIEDLLSERDPVVVAVGECGLDYHYDYSPRLAQREVFAAQVALAASLDLALVVHSREAWGDTCDILRAEGAPERTVFHCFTGGPEEAREALSLGAWLSFSGIVTFKGAGQVRQAASIVPSERLLVETDSPYLAPVPHRGRQNRPAWVPLVGAAVASARGETAEAVEEATWASMEAVFGL